MMEKTKKSSPARGKDKNKMTREQMQLAIIKKKESDAKALTIVERLLEPDVDPEWLVENLKDINRCHMEDAIEERAIVKLCGYVLCQKPLTVVYNQRYHISLKDKKVYDITKRKNFCCSNCFGASNYLLEQMLTSPLWLRDKEEIPKFRIFFKEKQESNISNIDAHGREVNIASVTNANQKDATHNIESQNDQSDKRQSQAEAEDKVTGCIESFVLEAVQDFELIDSTVDKNFVLSDEQTNINVKLTTKNNEKKVKTHKESHVLAEGKNNNSTLVCNVDQLTNSKAKTESKKLEILKNQMELETRIIKDIDVTEKDENTDTDDDIDQRIYSTENEITYLNKKCFDPLEKSQIESDDIIEQCSYQVECKSNKASTFELDSSDIKILQDHKSDKFSNDHTSKSSTKKKQKACKKLVDINLAAKVEESFHEWVTDQTIDYLFGDESIRQKIINTIEIQENYRILCGKLDRLQAQEDREDAEILTTTALKPAPHFAVLKEEGEKLDLKIRAFYEGKTTFEEPLKSNADKESPDNVGTFLPLTDIHAPQIIRRKIFLEKLDHVLPDLLRTLAGNNDVYARASLNYSSVRCTAVKALLHTFSLSAKNIVFKTAEWTLVGLVIIKMLSLSDPYLASLLSSKQANLYISMILTAYKLNSDYLNLLVTSFNPNMNPR